MNRPHALTVAGFDPTAGAGVSADIKTFEQLSVAGMNVVTGITVQSEDHFESVHWVDDSVLKAQLCVMLERYSFSAVKIGLVRDVQQLALILSQIESYSDPIPIVWDPILSATAGFAFHAGSELSDIRAMFGRVTLITPNSEEYKALTQEDTIPKIRSEFKHECAALITGIHRESDVVDILVDDDIHYLRADRLDDHDKHGSGCVLSAAIAAGLAKGESLKNAVESGRSYVRRFLQSNRRKLGYHAHI